MDESDDLRQLPKEDHTHFVILTRIKQLEDVQKNLEVTQAEIDKWRIKATIMLDSVEHMENRINTVITNQTAELKKDIAIVNTSINGVVEKQVFWANARLIAQWTGGILAALIIASWTVGSFIYVQLHEIK